MSQLETTVLKNTAGMEVTLVNFGARIASIRVPVNGELTEMLASYDNPEAYENDPFYLGATCGPVCNRITGAKFKLGGNTYQLSKNDGDNCVHSGDGNISFQYWQVKVISEQEVEYSLTLSHLSDNFPGDREFKVNYKLDQENKLHMLFTANSSEATIVNLTNHAYFNLGEDDISNLEMNIQAPAFLERESNGLPTGNYVNATELGYNLREWQVMDNLVNQNKYPQMAEEQGIDHCFVLDNNNVEQANAELFSKQNKVKLSVYTDQPAIQIYTGKFLAEPFKGYEGMCFECQGYTDAINKPNFPSTVLEPQQTYQNNTVYQFSTNASL